jgi:Na+-transporting methylmalonyl-CoA/oxaloacetate decarboxylase gamma subunit
MTRKHPDLIVPVRDRRQHKRYLTLKNFGKVMLVLTILFVAITIRSEMRGRAPGDFGRLFGREIETDIVQKPVEVVQEAPAQVPDATHADPMLVEPAARAQWLQDETATSTIVPVPDLPTATAATVRSSASEVSIVGGPEGVAVMRKEARPKPVLTGGFGR